MSDLVEDNVIEKQSIDYFIGQKLRSFRHRAGVTLADVANYVNLSKQLIQKYETGSTKIPASVLCRIADMLHIKPADFFEGYKKLHHQENENLFLTDEKTNTLKIFLISAAIEIDYMIQSLAVETKLKISTSNITSCDEIDNYARELLYDNTILPMPDIIIYDMPAQSCQIQNFIKKIRQKPFNSEAPIIILSSNAEIDLMKKAYFYGAAGYIYKNISADKLKKHLKHVVNYWGKACNLAGTNAVSELEVAG